MLFIDSREVVEHPEIPSLIGLEHSIILMPAADYAFFDYQNMVVGIERSGIANLIGKLKNKELERQLRHCKELYQSIILIVEGIYVPDKTGKLAIFREAGDFYRKTFTYKRVSYKYVKAVEVDLSRMGVEIFHSPSLDCTMQIVKLIYENRTKKPDDHKLFTSMREVALPCKISANPAVPKLLTLVPRLSEKSAVLLLHKYNTIWNILHAPDEELMRIEGVGKGAVKNLRESIGKEGK